MRAAIAASLLMIITPASPSEWRVVDGDTIKHTSGRNYRVMGFNAPEKNAACYEERALARRASDRLRDLLPVSDVRIMPGACGYGRGCVRITYKGEPVEKTLVAEGLVEFYVCVGNRCPKRKSWCD